jgi:hypothetical protein
MSISMLLSVSFNDKKRATIESKERRRRDVKAQRDDFCSNSNGSSSSSIRRSMALNVYQAN